MKHITIADSELPVMKALWRHGPLTSTQIMEYVPGNKSTVKTLLQRLVAKGAVEAQRINLRANRYTALISQRQYTRRESTGFIDRLFDGSARKMLMNFVQEEKITKEDIQRLLDMIEEE